MTSRSAHPATSIVSQAVPFVDLRLQTSQLEQEFMGAITEVVGRCDFILGAATTEFENAFARYIGVEQAIGVASGLDALRLSLVALDIQRDDEVILPANTFIATALAVSAVGARPVIVDCDADTYNIDPNCVEAAITPRTRAIIPVHLAGLPADMMSILDIANRNSLHVVEDACQAHGAKHGEKRCGSLGTTGCFSFYPGKNLGAFGDGGIVATNDASLAARLRSLRNYGQEIKYRHVELGGNSRLDTLQAAVLNVKLNHLDSWNAARASHAAEYRRRLSGVGDLKVQVSPDSFTHVYHLFIIETAYRDQLQVFLTDRGIQTGIHYPLPVHLQPAYSDLDHITGDFPVTENLASAMLSLPMFPELRTDQILYVTDAIRDFFARLVA